MGQIAQIITGMTDRMDVLSSGLLGGVDPDSAARFPVQEGKLISCNHPSFAFGHLALYPQMIMNILGLEPGDTSVPEQYGELFAKGVECIDDPDGSIYPPLSEIVEHFNRAYKALIEQAKDLDDSFLDKEIEGHDDFKVIFGTNGVLIMFMIHDHRMFHYGQVSTWRRFMGLGSAM